MAGDVVCGTHAGGDVAILLARILARGAPGSDESSAAEAGAGFLATGVMEGGKSGRTSSERINVPLGARAARTRHAAARSR